MVTEMDKKVLLTISVPKDNYCLGKESTCTYFNNEGGHPTCLLEGPICIKWNEMRYDKEGYVQKPQACSSLTQV